MAPKKPKAGQPKPATVKPPQPDTPNVVSQPPRPPGRPSDYRPEYCTALISHMERGYSYEAFAGQVGVNRDTLYAWEKANPEFSDAKKVAVEKGRLHWEEIGKLGMTGKLKGFSAAIWIFQMKNRFQWRDRVEHSGDEENPVKAEIKLTIRDYTDDGPGKP